MATITPGDAVTLVRRNLDELEPNASVMYGTGSNVNDNNSLDDIIKRHLPDAINAVHLAAPTRLLEGESVVNRMHDDATTKLADGQYLFRFVLEEEDTGGEFLRLVAFKANDTPYIVTEVVPYYSPEAHKQQNPYVRGRWDRPRLIRMPDANPTFNYYSFKTPSSKVETLLVILRQEFSTTATKYYLSPRLRDNIIDCLTAKVLESFGDQRAQSFYQKAYSFSNI